MKRLLTILFMFLFPLLGLCQSIVPEYYFTTDVASASIQPRQLSFVQGSSFGLNWRFLSGTSSVNLSSASTVYFEYGNTEGRETVTGTFTSASSGMVRVALGPLNTATNGLFPFNLRVSDSSSNVLCRTIGDLRLWAQAGTASGTWPSNTNIVDLLGYTFLNYPWATSSGTGTDLVARAMAESNTAALVSETNRAQGIEAGISNLAQSASTLAAWSTNWIATNDLAELVGSNTAYAVSVSNIAQSAKDGADYSTNWIATQVFSSVSTDWSQHPATQNVNMATFGMSELADVYMTGGHKIIFDGILGVRHIGYDGADYSMSGDWWCSGLDLDGGTLDGMPLGVISNFHLYGWVGGNGGNLTNVTAEKIGAYVEFTNTVRQGSGYLNSTSGVWYSKSPYSVTNWILIAD